MERIKKQRTVLCSSKIYAWFLIGAALLAGCSGAPTVTSSGFLPDYSLLQEDPSDGVRRWLAPREQLKQYKQFIIDPVVVHFSPNAKGTAIDPDELKELSDYFRTEVVKALSETKRYQVVTAPGSGVARVRIAITDIAKTRPLANIHPAMKLSGIGLGGAAMEAEVIDSVSGDQLAAVVDSQSGGRMRFIPGWQRYGHAKQVMGWWAERFVKRLDDIHGDAK